MSKYIKCPVCNLNYIKSDEKCCNVCNPAMKGKLISDAEMKYEEYRLQKLQNYNARKESMNAFYAIRFNRKPK